jgi:hypothetical protein
MGPDRTDRTPMSLSSTTSPAPPCPGPERCSPAALRSASIDLVECALARLPVFAHRPMGTQF